MIGKDLKYIWSYLIVKKDGNLTKKAAFHSRSDLDLGYLRSMVQIKKLKDFME